MNEVFVHSWKDIENPKGVVQIFHGMAEHAARYADFAAFLNSAGFLVYADDHRGHGKTAGTVEELGYIGKDGFNKIVEDERLISIRIKREYPELPLLILGHSFGSFIAQEYITRYGREIAGVILSGTSMMDGPEVTAGKIIAWLQKTFTGERKKSKLIDKMGFGSYNKRIANPASTFSWLTRDEKIVKMYEDDPFCGTVFTANFYYYFFKGAGKLYKLEKLGEIPEALPVFIIGGDEDPVGGYGKNITRLRDKYLQLGLDNVRMKLYPGARHEVLNEINRQEVYTDVLEWISANM
jgi:alpha-beta hydrolase superfamily lysophospholipase